MLRWVVLALCVLCVAADDNMCVTPVPLGGECTGSDQCLLYAECIGGKCVVLEPGVACASQSDCGSYMACVEDKCRVLKIKGDACASNAECITQNCVEQKCTGVAVGGACNEKDAFNPCEGGFCMEGVCAASLKEGDSCGIRIARQEQAHASVANFVDVCEGGTTCTGADTGDIVANAKCTRSFSVPAGGKCLPMGATGCELNLVCQVDGTTARCTNTTGNACTRANAATVCGLASACLCDEHGEGHCALASNVGVRSMGALEALLDCAHTHSCPNSMLGNALGAMEEGTCLNAACAEQREDAECTARFGYAETYHSHYSCGGRTGDGERRFVEDWGIALITVGGVCLLALILFMWLRNRRLQRPAIDQNRLLH